jgi:hypothetical protein
MVVEVTWPSPTGLLYKHPADSGEPEKVISLTITVGPGNPTSLRVETTNTTTILELYRDLSREARGE